MVELTNLPLSRLYEMLVQAAHDETMAAFDDCHASYIQRTQVARQEQRRIQAEIDRREAHYEAINGR